MLVYSFAVARKANMADREEKDTTKIHIRSTHKSVGDMWTIMSPCPPATNNVQEMF